MIYEVDVVNPKTNEERTLTVEVTAEQNTAARISTDWMREVQLLAEIPDGFMPIGGRVRPLPLTAIN
jgi:hypothetical protein